MDITVIVPPTNKAGQTLVKMLEEDNKHDEFRKIITILTGYCKINKYLLGNNVVAQYVYDVIYNDYKSKIVDKFDKKYETYILCLLHTKYDNFLTEMRDMVELYCTHEDNNIV
jgi:hypothetical protein